MDEWDLGPSPKPSNRASEPPADETPAQDTTSARSTITADGGTEGGHSNAGEEAPHPSGRRRRPAVLGSWVAAALLLMAVGAVIGFAVARAQHDDITAELSRKIDELGVVERALSQAEERNWNYYRQNQALKAQIDAIQHGGTTSTSSTAGGQTGRVAYGDGIYLVGEGIQPGTYDGVVVGTQGYWARLKATDGQVGSILANAIPQGPFVLTIVVSDRAVELRGVSITPR